MFYWAEGEKKKRDVRLFHIDSFWKVHGRDHRHFWRFIESVSCYVVDFTWLKEFKQEFCLKALVFYRLTSWLLLKMEDGRYTRSTKFDALFDRRRLLRIYANFYYQRRCWVSFASELPLRTWMNKMRLFDSNQPTPKT